MNIEDTNAEIEMYFKQIISISDLILESNDRNSPNILIIRELAQNGLAKQQSVTAKNSEIK